MVLLKMAGHSRVHYQTNLSTFVIFEPPGVLSRSKSNNIIITYTSLYYYWYVLQKRGVLRHNLTKNDLPESSRHLLNTSCAFFDRCIGALVPQVGKKFPNASVELEMYSSVPPVAGIDPQNLTGAFSGVVVLRARLSDGSLAHLFGMNVTAKIRVAPRLEGTVLKATVTSMENTLEVVDSRVGRVSAELLGLAFDVAKKSFIIPKLNEAGATGFPLPTVKHVKFTNTAIQLENNCVRVATDVEYSPSALYFQP